MPTCFAPPDRDGIAPELKAAWSAAPPPDDEGLLALEPVDALVPLTYRSVDALGRMLPSLVCAEESAVHVFSREGDRLGLSDESLIASQRLMYQIAREEELHEILLARLQANLPVPQDFDAVRRKARWLFIRAASPNPAIHFYRISELDSGVCQIMTALLQPVCSVRQILSLRRQAERIRRDEAGHVRAALDHVSRLGLPHAQKLESAEVIRSELIGLLTYIGDSFEVLGTDPDRMIRKIQNRKIPER
jgi:hypothetical protein